VLPGLLCIVKRQRSLRRESLTIEPFLPDLQVKFLGKPSSLSADEEANPGRRLGQAGLIRCRAPTVPGSPPEAKKQKLMHKYEPAAPAIKQSSSAARLSVVPISALHNVVKDRFQRVHYEVSGTPLMGNIAGVTKVIDFRRRNEAISSVTAKRISFLGAERLSWKYEVWI
jgi:hypothetical protein